MTALCGRFGSVVRARRIALRWSQEVLADRAAINRSYLGEVERGQVVPSLITMHKLADALEVRLSTLLARCEQPTGVDAEADEALMAIDG